MFAVDIKRNLFEYIAKSMKKQHVRNIETEPGTAHRKMLFCVLWRIPGLSIYELSFFVRSIFSYVWEIAEKSREAISRAEKAT